MVRKALVSTKARAAGMQVKPEGEWWGFKPAGTKCRASILLEWRIFNTAKHYMRLTVGQLYYILIRKVRYPARSIDWAAKIARPVTEKLRKMIERKVFRLLEAGIPEEEILAQLASKYVFCIRRRRAKGG